MRPSGIETWKSSSQRLRSSVRATPGPATAMNLLKVNASEMAISTVMSSFQACGLAGYRNDGEFSISRSVRDILSSCIMLNNDRILANVASASLLSEVPATLRD